MKLENIGFYTLSDARCAQVSPTSPMWRCEIILTDRCNFKCPYCRGRSSNCQGDMPYEKVMSVLTQWMCQGLKNIRFSGGEPLLYPYLGELVEQCKLGGVEHIAISTNGSYPFAYYNALVAAGVNDFSISLDACCAAAGGKMAGCTETVWQRVVKNIAALAKETYVTVGVVLTEQNVDNLTEIVEFAHSLGVADIRIISAAQYNQVLDGVKRIPQEVLNAHPILKYRVENMLNGRNVRGIRPYDSQRCHLPIDDSIVRGDYHYPCVVFMREGGEPIGKVGPNMRQERVEWAENHCTHCDPICKKNCLDICIDHNNRFQGQRYTCCKGNKHA